MLFQQQTFIITPRHNKVPNGKRKIVRLFYLTCRDAKKVTCWYTPNGTWTRLMMLWRDHLYRFLAGPLMVLCLCLGGLSPHAAAQSGLSNRPPAGSQAAQLEKQGEDLSAQGRFAEAEIPLKQAVEYAPENYELLTLLGKVEGRLGKHAEAIATFRRVVRVEPKEVDGHINLAIVLADAGQLEEALAETSTAISLSPKLASAHVNKARLLADLHRPEEAEKEFLIANQLAPNNPECLYYWGLLEKDRGNLAKQTSLFQQLVRLQPDNLNALILLAQSLQHEEKGTEAISVLRHILQLKPDSENALYMLSMELRRTDPEESNKLRQKYEAAKHKDADLAQVKSLGNEANEAAGRQDWAEAIRILRTALESCGGCSIAGDLHKNLGLALCQSGSIDECKGELQEALKLKPNDPDIMKAYSIATQ
jgi:tetratricopeptide (TPR) repeat protein